MCGAEAAGVSPVPRQAEPRYAWGCLWQAWEPPEHELPWCLQGWILPVVPRAAGQGDPPELWGKTTAVGQPPRPGSPHAAGLALPRCWGTWEAPKSLHRGAIAGGGRDRMQQSPRGGNNLAAIVHGQDTGFLEAALPGITHAPAPPPACFSTEQGHPEGLGAGGDGATWGDPRRVWLRPMAITQRDRCQRVPAQP